MLSASFPDPNNPVDLRIRYLGREATRLKSEGDIHQAVSCLEEIWVAVWDSSIGYDAKLLVRLPMYLQHAGRFSEAEQRFQTLLKVAEKYARKASKDHDLAELYAPFLENSFLHDVYHAMRIAYKRAKKTEVSNEYADLANKHYDIAQGYANRMQDVRDKQLNDYLASRKNRRNFPDPE